MPYDAKDPDTIKAVKELVDAALAEAAEEHASDKEGVVKKNTELLAKLKKAREGNADPEAIEKLEKQLEDLKAENQTLAKTVKTVTKERDTNKAALDGETTASRKLLVDQGLTEALLKNKVANQFLPAVKKLLEGQVTIKADGDARTAMVGDKPLAEFVGTWSQSDEGKIYVVAPANGGGGAPGANGSGKDGKTATRTVFNGMSHADRATFSKEGGQVIDG